MRLQQQQDFLKCFALKFRRFVYSVRSDQRIDDMDGLKEA